MRMACLTTTLSLCLRLAKNFSIREAKMTLGKSKLNFCFNITCVKQFNNESIYDEINEGYL